MPHAADETSSTISPNVAEQVRAGAARPKVSILVPFLDEVGNIAPLAAELRAALESQSRSWEVLLIDDGSTDGSLAAARAVHDGDSRFRVVPLKVHYGKSAALAAGRDQSRGEVLVTIDADLQDPPAAIPAFLDAIDAGSDVVAAWRNRRKEPWYRRAASAVFNRGLAWFTKVPIHDMNAGLKAYRRPVLASIHLSRGMHRFLAVLAHARGFRVTEMAVEHGRRHSGSTKYGLWRYAETIICIVTVTVLRRGPDAAMRTMTRLAAMMVLGGVVLVVLGWLAHLTVALVVGAICLIIASQLLISRLVAEILFQLSSLSGDAPPPYQLSEEGAFSAKPGADAVAEVSAAELAEGRR